MAVLFGCSGTGWGWEDALAAHDAGHYEEALRLLAPLGATGNVDAQNKLSHMYWYGEGTPVDYAAALNWSGLRRKPAALRHFTTSACTTRRATACRRATRTLSLRSKRQPSWVTLLARRIVAMMYLGGTGVARHGQVRLLDGVAADRGEPLAQLFLAGARMSEGRRAEADRLLQEAASENLAEAQYTLGQLFLEGEDGWPVDPVQAHMWLSVARASGCLEAAALAKRALAMLTTEQQAEFAALVSMWQEANPIEPGRVHPIKPRACDQGGDQQLTGCN